ncbi:hypothetical protein [Chondromyces apiculatus]|uniref:Lipoprotein n=1 Tax=Chondromyces apiculatus DSM 436 TaxID=1192034 RepID=A0A017T1J9_9BACT|nr:hypothetical protein [Chondromyces apiculatus]EYF03124.1 Hypothetical protein CAP_6238 [Chondromyces apiculatus DSM 436]
MAFPSDVVKRRSPGLWTILLATAAFGLGGCVIIEGEHGDSWDDGGDVATPPPVATDPMLMSIQTDATVSAEPGEGVGVFVEYATDGLWRVWTTCDTNHSDLVCLFDIFVSVEVGAELIDLGGVNLEGRDQATLYDEGVAYLQTSTASDVDEMEVVTTPGAIVRLEAYLDGVAQPRFIFWQGEWEGEEVLHQGAPSHPVDFEPLTP